jgi:hypothetical protein
MAAVDDQRWSVKRGAPGHHSGGQHRRITPAAGAFLSTTCKTTTIWSSEIFAPDQEGGGGGV